MCIPRGKKLQQSTRETCVYCARKQKEANRNEEAKILENFQERFYRHAHHGPTIQTKVQLDHGKMHSNDSAAIPRLSSEEDRKLEERLRQLKASRKPVGPSYSEDEIRHKLTKLRESNSTTSSSQPSTSETTRAPQDPGPSEERDGTAVRGLDKTQVEQAQDLLEQASDEVKLDAKLAESKEKKDENLYTRLQVLKGEEGGDAAKQFHSAKPNESESDVQKFLGNMEVKVTDGDNPEKLLEDLREFQAKEEKSALAEAQSDEIQALVGRFQKSEEQEEGTSDSHEARQPDHSEVPYITPYSTLLGLKSDAFGSEANTDKVSKEDIAKLMKGAAEEIRREEHLEKETRAFIQDTSERLANLRNKSSEKTNHKEEVSNPEEEDSEPVSSKVTSGGAQNLDFSWNHFGPIPRNPSSELLATHQLGITNFPEEDDEEAKSLMDKMIAEAALDSRLEASGYNLDAAPQASALSKRDRKDHHRDLGGASVGASAASNYWSNDSDDELPWCCICNRDATLRCYDCDDDLYCTRCFSEGHEQFGLFDHRYAPYQPHTKAE